MTHSGNVTVTAEFQSSPGPKAGRCDSGEIVGAYSTLPFQSSPGPKAGRCAACPGIPDLADREFQSSPGPKAGRCNSVFFLTRNGLNRFQSSPGPKAGRCGPSTPRSRWLPSSFQSSPGPKAGRCVVDGGARAEVHHQVSILARPEGRALLLHTDTGPLGHLVVSILARPEGRALHSKGAFSTTIANNTFQSSPGPKAGRCVVRDDADHRRHHQVSILARPEGRALLATAVPKRISARLVSILARPEGRALPDTDTDP